MPARGPIRYHTVARIGDLPPGGLFRVEVAGRRICLANAKGEILAVDDACTHARASLSEGTLHGTRLACPLHGGAFDARSGEALTYPAVQPVKTYRVEIDGDEIRVGIREGIDGDQPA